MRRRRNALLKRNGNAHAAGHRPDLCFVYLRLRHGNLNVIQAHTGVQDNRKHPPHFVRAIIPHQMTNRCHMSFLPPRSRFPDRNGGNGRPQPVYYPVLSRLKMRLMDLHHQSRRTHTQKCLPMPVRRHQNTGIVNGTGFGQHTLIGTEQITDKRIAIGIPPGLGRNTVQPQHVQQAVQRAGRLPQRMIGRPRMLHGQPFHKSYAGRGIPFRKPLYSPSRPNHEPGQRSWRNGLYVYQTDTLPRKCNSKGARLATCRRNQYLERRQSPPFPQRGSDFINQAGTICSCSFNKSSTGSMAKIMIAFDVETTGRNPDTDQIVEISMCLYNAGKEETYHTLIRPDIPITKGAQAVHGISMDDVKDAPTFAQVAPRIRQFLEGATVLVGYNVRFDIRCVEREFDRLGETVDLTDKLVVDPYRIWQSLEPRSLSDAYRRFVGGELDNAHSAEADVQAAVNVLRGMRRTFNLEEATWEELAQLTSPDQDTWIGPSNHIVWSAGEVVFGFGKYAGRPVLEVAQRDRSYLDWIQRADFPKHVGNLCKGALLGLPEEDFNGRIVASFGEPPAPAEPAPTAPPPPAPPDSAV